MRADWLRGRCGDRVEAGRLTGQWVAFGEHAQSLIPRLGGSSHLSNPPLPDLAQRTRFAVAVRWPRFEYLAQAADKLENIGLLL